MFRIICTTFIVSITASLYGQDETASSGIEPVIVGEISDGRPVQQESSPEPLLPDFVVKDSVVVEDGSRRISINAVEEPFLPPTKKESPKSDAPPLTSEEIESLLSEEVTSTYFSVLATVYDNSKTFVTFSDFQNGQREKFSVWSNLNWNHLGGFSSFEVGEQQFTFLLILANVSGETLEQRQAEEGEGIPEVPAVLPDFETSDARYVLMEGDEENHQALDFIEGLHELYVHRREELEAAYLEREKQKRIRLEALKNQQSEEENDITINYWAGEGAREIPK